MRAVHLSDLHHAACALRDVAEVDQRATIDAAVTAAHVADCYRKRCRKAHPKYGSGTLSSALGSVAEPSFCDAAYLRALQVVIAAILARKAQ